MSIHKTSTCSISYYFMPFASLFFFSCAEINNEHVAEKPNIIIIYADDLGYGDLGSYGAIGVNTPALDSLAQHGIKFTDAHCTAATCTPSRYSLLTGSYAFRNNAEVLPGNSPLLIDPDKGTLPAMLKEAGYKTAVVGKWHLGLGNRELDWNEAIKPGPLEVGFDYSFIIPATGDRVPCVFVENYHVVSLSKDDPIQVSYDGPIGDGPTGTSNPELLKQQADPQHSETIINGVSRIGYMTGGHSAWWKDEDFADILTEKAESFIAGNKDNPFFLFFSFHDIHVPRIPHERFVGQSKMGPRGDAIVQMDWCVKQIMKSLDTFKLSSNTLVIFTSDNGPVLDDGYADRSVELLGQHQPGGPFRGGKYSAFEAGTRVPTIVHWPEKVKAKVSDALLSQVDLYASIASIVDGKIGAEDAPDSFDFSKAWLGKSDTGRSTMLEESVATLALRDGQWKYIREVPNVENYPVWVKDIKAIEHGVSTEAQLYNLTNDPHEQHNLAEKYPERAKEMRATIQEIEKRATRPGWANE